MKKQLLILMTLFTVLIGHTQTFNALDNNNNTLEFDITSATTVEVKAYISGGTDIDIPLTVSHNSITYDVTSIGNSTFENKNLTTITIPNSIINIGSSAFSGNQLTSITIPNSITIIPDFAFSVNQLNSVTIPNSITSIGLEAFSDNNLTSVTIPSGVTTIGDEAFRYNPLINITISSSVTSIGAGTFISNTITDVYSLATIPPTIFTGSSDTFGVSLRSNIHLHIPVGTMGAYVTDSGALWTGFNPVTEDALLSSSDFELVNNIKIITTTDAIKVISSDNVRIKNYTIYSISGAKIKEGTESTIAIDIIANGIYILKLDFAEGKITKKVVIK